MTRTNDLFELIDQSKTHEQILSCVKNIFDEILNEKKWTTEFFLHPLGFYYCRLGERTTNQLRLHIWKSDYKVKEDLFIHDHYYDLCSWVLCGKILDYSYSVLPGNKKSMYTKFVSGYIENENRRVLRRTDKFKSVEKNGERTILKGQKYSILKESYHSNIVLFDESEITATLVFTYNHKDNHAPNVIGLYTDKDYMEDDPISISEIEIKQLIEIAKKEIFKI